MWPSLDNLILLAVAAFVCCGLWRATRKHYRVCIVAGPDEIKIVRGIAGAQQAAVLQFLRQDIELSRPVTILATKYPNGRLQMKIQGQLDAGLRQRIRNFLLTVL